MYVLFHFRTFTFGNDVNDQQVGCLWQYDTLISVSLSGDINYLDPQNPNKPAKVVKGHNKVITALTFDAERNKLITGDYGADVSILLHTSLFLFPFISFSFSTYHCITISISLSHIHTYIHTRSLSFSFCYWSFTCVKLNGM
jgi:hypothetical protein